MDKKEQALKLRQQGVSTRQIGRFLGVSKSAVSKWTSRVMASEPQGTKLTFLDLNPGDRVSHKKYGEGTVLESWADGVIRYGRVQFGEEEAQTLVFATEWLKVLSGQAAQGATRSRSRIAS
jgi:hypothetical protein